MKIFYMVYSLRLIINELNIGHNKATAFLERLCQKRYWLAGIKP